MRNLIRLLAYLGLFVLAFTHVGAWIPLGDSLAIGRPIVLVAGIAIAFLLVAVDARKLALVSLAAVMVSGALTWRDFAGSAPREVGQYTLYQKNLLWNGTTPEEILADIRLVSPDFITLQETSQDNAIILEGLEGSHPHRLACASQGNGGIAVLSRFPLEISERGCQTGSGIVIAEAQFPNGDSLWVGSVHLNWPFPYNQNTQVRSVLAGLSQIDGDVILGGDFNMVPWGSSVRRVAREAGAVRVGGYGSTFPGFGTYAPLIIDHVMVPKGTGATAALRPLLGSDHHGLELIFSR